MPVYNVSYDLSKPSQEYEDLFKEIKRSKGTCHVLQSTWMVETQESAEDLFDRLATHIDRNDNLFVIETKNHWKGRFAEDMGDCIRDLFR